jgi:hypothetical protein
MDKLTKMEELVVTIIGETVPRSNCRRINGEFYLIGDTTLEDSGQCYLINDKYYKYNTGYIKYDNRLRIYVIKNTATLIEGVVGINKKGDIVLGYFSYAPKHTSIRVQLPDGSIYECISKEIFKNSPFQENLSAGMFTHRLYTKATRFLYLPRVSDTVKRDLPYDSRGQMGNLMDHHKNLNVPISNTVKKYGKAIKDLTFGVEFETIKGQIPTNKCADLGLIALRDGSIGGLEYATIPLQGEKGIQTLLNSVEELEKYTTFDKTCSLHFHIGNIPRTEEFFLAFFKTMCVLESQMYDLVPLYKKYNFGVKRKHYTKPYPLSETMYQLDKSITKSNISKNFAVLYKYLSMGQNYSEVDSCLENVTYHPSDPGGNGKWNIRSRYHGINVIPLLFGNKETVEFRLHTPTYESSKIMNYLILCTSIVNFVKDNTSQILKDPAILNGLVLHDIVFKVLGQLKDNNNDYTHLSEVIYSYLRNRKDFYYQQGRAGNIDPIEEKFRWNRNIKWLKDKDDKELVLSKISEKVRLRLNGIYDVVEEEPVYRRGNNIQHGVDPFEDAIRGIIADNDELV